MNISNDAIDKAKIEAERYRNLNEQLKRQLDELAGALTKRSFECSDLRNQLESKNSNPTLQDAMNVHVSPGIPISHELFRLREYDKNAQQMATLGLALDPSATSDLILLIQQYGSAEHNQDDGHALYLLNEINLYLGAS